MLDEGLDELAAVIDGCAGITGVVVEADLRIARGLDYYTGTVFETRMAGYQSLGSVCSGGRYDSLASDGKTTYPGVGISLGVIATAAAAVPGRAHPRVPVGAVRRARRAAGRGLPRGVRRGRSGAAGAGDPRRGRSDARRSTASRSATPNGGGSRSCGSRGNLHEVKDIRSGDQARGRSRDLDAP